MIYTVTLNPAIDYVMEVDSLEQGAPIAPGVKPFILGGKGINVSVVLKSLGLRVLLWDLPQALPGKRWRRCCGKGQLSRS